MTLHLHPHEVPMLESPDEHVKEVDEGKLDESSEDGHEAHDDKDVQCCGIGNLETGGR